MTGAGDHRSIARVLLAIDLASEPIAGSVSVDGETSHRFNGWIELTTAIEAARGGGASGRRELRRGGDRQPGKDWGRSLG